MNKKITFSIIGILIALILALLSWKTYQYLRIKYAKIEINLVEDLTIEFYDKRKVSDFIQTINGTIIDDFEINSTKLGKQDITFEFINQDHIKLKYTYQIEVIDTTAPVIWLGNRYRVSKDTQIDLTQEILCGDNYDNNPTCIIEGDYDLTTVGDYPLTFRATDQSGNTETQNFILEVYEPTKKKQPTKIEYQPFADIVKQHKTEHTQIGIDVSSWQGDIDFNKLKQAGVEFIIIRVGGTRGTNGEYFLDSKFVQNIKAANEYKIPVGIYFYSYANSLESARKDAEWVLEQIHDYQVDLPIAFDWEEWGSYNNYHLSFFGLTSMAEEFLKTIEQKGYQGMLYSSKSYLEKIWLPTTYDIWLAHYTDQTNYEKDYKFWQICNNGTVDGIEGAVDINMMKIK